MPSRAKKPSDSGVTVMDDKLIDAMYACPRLLIHRVSLHILRAVCRNINRKDGTFKTTLLMATIAEGARIRVDHVKKHLDEFKKCGVLLITYSGHKVTAEIPEHLRSARTKKESEKSDTAAQLSNLTADERWVQTVGN